MHTIRVYTKHGSYKVNTSDPNLMARDTFDDFVCPKCGWKGTVIGHVIKNDFTGECIGIVECPKCDYEEEY